MLVLLHIAGGVALLLFGVRYIRKGLDRLFGRQLAVWMSRVGAKPGLAFLSGIGVAVAAPSSTTISVLAVQAVQTGHMTARQMLAVMLGANIGLTVLVQLVALRVDAYAPIAIFVGFVLFQYSGWGRVRGVGQVILALGFLFLAMSLIRSAIAGADIGRGSDLQQLIEIVSHYPVPLVILAAIMATLLQSATATIGLIIGLTAATAIGMTIALPVVIGANVGLAVTTLVVGWRRIESRRLGMANLLLKLVVATAALALMPQLVVWLDALPFDQPVQVAMAHTGFNVAQAIIGMPTLRLLDQLVRRCVPDLPPGSTQVFGPKFIHQGSIDSPALATTQSLREILHMSEIVRGMLRDVWIAMKTNDERLAYDVSQRDNQVDLLDAEIKRFLTRLAKDEMPLREADEEMRQLQYLTELETVGDIIDKNISELVLKRIRTNAHFTPEGERELDDFYQKVAENQILADAVFTTRDRGLAEQLLRHKEYLNQYEQELRDRHFARLKAGLVQAHETSAIHLDLLTHLKRINSAISHVAYPILQDGQTKRTIEFTSLDSVD